MSDESPDILYVADMARKFGKSERALRGLIHRKSEAIPPPMKLGKLYAWRRQEVESWLEARVAESVGA